MNNHAFLSLTRNAVLEFMAKSNPTPDPLDENILRRLQYIESANGLTTGTATLSRGPKSLLPMINLDRPQDRTNHPTSFSENPALDISHTASHRIRCQDGDVWISGNSLLCACPDCAAPMTIRIWLRLADCWRCDSSVSLSEEQIRAVHQLAELAPPPKSRPAPLAPAPAPRPQSNLPAPAPPSIDAPLPLGPGEQELEHLSRGSIAARLVRDGFKLTPAWMVSFILHLIVILILALIMLGDKSFLPETITLSTFLSSEKATGGEIRFENPDDLLQDDLAFASDMSVSDRELRNVLRKANQDAKALQVDPQPLAPLPDLNRIKKNITTTSGPLMSFAARDPRVRAEIVRKQGGTTITEAAVSRGIRWLASVQNHDGGWSLGEYKNHKRQNNKSDIMGTSLALLPMLGAGQTHEFGAYKQTVAEGLAWILENQKANGDLRAGYEGQAGMYAHGQAAIVLCEALALTGDQKFRDPAQRAIRFIELAQHAQGGWRYRPGQEGDTSVFGWQMMALQSARSPDLNLNVDESTIKMADYFLDKVTANARFNNRRKTKLPKGSAYCYQPGRNATAAMTAEAILCRMYLGWKKDDPRLSSAVNWLIQDHFPSARDGNLYYWYYGTQVMHHYGGEPWDKWNDKMRELLISSQETRGSYPGSWSPNKFEWGPKGGRIYTTSLAVCTLEVYYRHLPLFKQIELDD